MPTKVLTIRHRSDIADDLRHRAALHGKDRPHRWVYQRLHHRWPEDDTHRRPQARQLTQNELCAVAHLEAAWPLGMFFGKSVDTYNLTSCGLMLEALGVEEACFSQNQD